VLPLGDSITFGLINGGSNGGYRVELFRLAVTNNLSITFVGSGDPNGPSMVEGRPFPKAHEGFSGWTIQQIHNRLFNSPDRGAVDAEPEIVLLHIGTNDMYLGADGAPQRLGTLIDSLTERLPESLIVVSTIIPFPGSANNVTTYNTALVSVVNERISAGKHVAFVDQFEGFPTGELGDGVHPTQAGYNRMGAKWFAAISEYLPPLE
jgi:lysophospholipase L1-like esterase